MKKQRPIRILIPGLGLRSIKTGIAVMFTAFLYALPIFGGDPTFACIGAIFGMGADMQESRRNGGNRFFGTIFGGFIGLVLYWLEHLIVPDGNYWLCLPLAFVGVIILISICVFFQWPGGVQPGGVVLCIILFNTPAHHIDYALRRMIDTGIGVLIAFMINSRFDQWLHLKYAGQIAPAPEAAGDTAAAVPGTLAGAKNPAASAAFSTQIKPDATEEPLMLTASDAIADAPHSSGIIVLSPDISDREEGIR